MSKVCKPKAVILRDQNGETVYHQGDTTQASTEAGHKGQHISFDFHFHGDNQAPTKPQQYPESKWQKAIRTWKPVGEIVALFIALWGGWCVYRQADFAERQLKEMQITRMDDERAWVCQSEIHIVTNVANSLAVEVVVKNTGKTPALHVHAVIGFTTETNSISQDDSYLVATSHGDDLLAPNAVLYSSIALDRISQQEKVAMANGKLGFYFGTTWYDDTNKRHHWTQFCYFFDLNRNNFKGAGFHNWCDQ
jgi:hypothetical protein